MYHHDSVLPGQSFFVLAAFVLAVGLRATPAAAQHNDTYSFKLQSRGMGLLDAGLAAMGGRAAIEQAGTARLSAHFTVYRLGQGLRPDAPPTAGDPAYMVLTCDHRSRTTVYEIFPSDSATDGVGHLVLSPADTFFYDRGRNLVEGVAEPDALQVILRAISYPPAILLDAAEHAATVRWLGRSATDEASYDVVTYIDAIGQQKALYFDTRTNLLARLEIIESHPQFGDHAVATTFSDYRAVGPLLLPHHMRSNTAGVPSTEARLTQVLLGADPPQELLTRPAHAGVGPTITGNHPAANLKATELADGVYAIFDAAGGYNVMFVDLGRSVFVIEPVISPEVSRAVIDVVEATVPGRPIRHVLMTHHHFDHSGGLLEFLAEGATIVANPGDVAFIHDVARAPRTLDGEGASQDTPRVEVVEGQRTYGTGAGTVELYQVGPNPHVEELLVAYLPAHRLLYVADVYNQVGQLTPANEQTLALADAIEALGLDFRRIIPTHGGEATGEQFWESVRLGREASGR